MGFVRWQRPTKPQPSLVGSVLHWEAVWLRLSDRLIPENRRGWTEAPQHYWNTECYGIYIYICTLIQEDFSKNVEIYVPFMFYAFLIPYWALLEVWLGTSQKRQGLDKSFPVANFGKCLQGFAVFGCLFFLSWLDKPRGDKAANYQLCVLTGMRRGVLRTGGSELRWWRAEHSHKVSAMEGDCGQLPYSFKCSELYFIYVTYLLIRSGLSQPTLLSEANVHGYFYYSFLCAIVDFNMSAKLIL